MTRGSAASAPPSFIFLVRLPLMGIRAYWAVRWLAHRPAGATTLRSPVDICHA